VQVAGENPWANGPSRLSSGRPLCRLSNGVNEAYTLKGFSGSLAEWTGYTALEMCIMDC